METPLELLPITPRKSLRPGVLFRIKRGSGPRSLTTGEPTGAESGEYRCLRIWRDSRRPQRVYCDAVGSVSGRQHSLYVAGPRYRCPSLHTIQIRPYAIEIVSQGPPQKQRPVRRHPHQFRRKPR